MTYREGMRAAATAYWRRLLKRTRWNITAAAREAGVNRTSVYKYIQRLGIKIPRTAPRGRWSEFGL